MIPFCEVANLYGYLDIRPINTEMAGYNQSVELADSSSIQIWYVGEFNTYFENIDPNICLLACGSSMGKIIW